MMTDDWETSEERRQKIANANYKVGFGKPPKKHQFKKGTTSPNPKGRPKGAKGLKSLVCAAAEAPAEFILNGKKTTAPRIQVALHQLSLKAAKGELKAIDRMTQLYEQFGPPSAIDEGMVDEQADTAALDEFLVLAAKFSKNTK